MFAGGTSQGAGARDHQGDVGGWGRERVTSTEEVDRVVRAVTSAMADAGYPECDVFAVRLALDEAVVNGIQHGHGFDPAKQVEVRYQVAPQRVLVEVEDQGPGFDPQRVPDPLAPENLEQPGGRGVFLMRHYMTAVEYNATGNRVTLRKVRKNATPQAPG